MRPFEEFWRQYPARNGRKCGKAEAFAIWKALKVTEELYAEIMTALALQKKHYAACKAQKVFVAEFPDACRWLKKRRWEDEVFGIPEQLDRDPEEVRHAAHVQRTKEYIDGRKRDEQDAVPMPEDVRKMVRRQMGYLA